MQWRAGPSLGFWKWGARIFFRRLLGRVKGSKKLFWKSPLSFNKFSKSERRWRGPVFSRRSKNVMIYVYLLKINSSKFKFVAVVFWSWATKQTSMLILVLVFILMPDYCICMCFCVSLLQHNNFVTYFEFDFEIPDSMHKHKFPPYKFLDIFPYHDTSVFFRITIA